MPMDHQNQDDFFHRMASMAEPLVRRAEPGEFLQEIARQIEQFKKQLQGPAPMPTSQWEQERAQLSQEQLDTYDALFEALLDAIRAKRSVEAAPGREAEAARKHRRRILWTVAFFTPVGGCSVAAGIFGAGAFDTPSLILLFVCLSIFGIGLARSHAAKERAKHQTVRDRDKAAELRDAADRLFHETPLWMTSIPTDPQIVEMYRVLGWSSLPLLLAYRMQGAASSLELPSQSSLDRQRASFEESATMMQDVLDSGNELIETVKSEADPAEEDR